MKILFDPGSKSWYFPDDITDSISPYDSADPANEPKSVDLAISENGDVVVVWQQNDSGGNSQIFKSEKRNGVWSIPSGLDDNISPDGTNAYSPEVAIDKIGNTVVIWRQSDGATVHLYKREYRSGSWSSEPVLGSPVSSNVVTSSGHDVAMSDNGEAVIIWRQTDPVEHIYYSDYRSGSWNSRVKASVLANENCEYPKIGMGDNGDAVIIFKQSNGTNEYICYNHYKNGSWTGTSSLGAANVDADIPIMDMNSQGDILVVWEHNPGATQVYYRLYNRGNDSWSAVPAVATDNISIAGQNASQKVCALNNIGNFVISWEESNGSVAQIYTSDYFDGVLVVPVDLLTDSISVNGTDAGGKLAGIDSGGNAVIIWQQSDESNDQIYKADLRNHVWSKPANSTDYISIAGTDAGDKAFSMSENGNAIVSWEQSGGTNVLLYISYYADGQWHHPSSIDDFVSFNGYNTASKVMAMDPNGNGIIVWEQGTDSNNRLYVAEFR